MYEHSCVHQRPGQIDAGNSFHEVFLNSFPRQALNKITDLNLFVPSLFHKMHRSGASVNMCGAAGGVTLTQGRQGWQAEAQQPVRRCKRVDPGP